MRFRFVPIILWWLTLCWTFTTAWPRPFDDWKNTLLYLGAGILSCLWLWRKRSSLTLAVNAPVGCLLFYLIIGTATLQTPIYEGLLSLARLILWVGLVWSLIQFKKEDLIALAKWSVGSAATIALLSWFALQGFPLWKDFNNFAFLAPIGHTTYYGDFMALHLPLAGFFILASTTRTQKTLWSVCFLLILMGLWIAGTRASIVAVGSAFVFGMMIAGISRCFRWRDIATVTMVIVGLVLLINMIQPSGHRSLPTLARMMDLIPNVSKKPLEEISSGRWHTYLTTKNIIAEKPIRGWGIGSFRFIYPEYAHAKTSDQIVTEKKWFMHPHNEILNQAMELGIFGLLVFICLWGSLYSLGLVTLYRSRNRGRQLLLIIALMGITTSLVSWQFSTNFLFPLSRLLTALFIALLWKEIHEAAPSLKQVSFRHLSIPLFVLITIATFFVGSSQASLYAIRQGQGALSWEEREIWARRARGLAPLAFDPLLFASSTFLGSGDWEQARRMIEALSNHYPFVPIVLYQTALLKLHDNQREEAISFLEHTLKNAPDFEEARRLLASLK